MMGDLAEISHLLHVRFGKELVTHGGHSVGVVAEALVRVTIHQLKDLVLRLPILGRRG